jgi:uncharacterized membrane protein
MILMALDHTRDFFHSAAMSFQPEDLTRTTVPIFFTRWITHFCAPVFMFTAGLGASFWLQRDRTLGQLSSYLVKRGLWLAFLELTVVRFALVFNFHVDLVVVTVLWGLGWSMVALALLVHLPVRVLAVFSLAVIALHNLADPIDASQFGSAAWLWNCLHQLGVFHVGGIGVLVSYPLVPWFAVMAAGFCLGHIAARPWMLRIGLGVTIAFVIVRGINIYGDPAPWSHSVLSFLRCNKYPPSLDFLLMTLGPALLLLVWFDRFAFTPTNPLIVFGRVPLFYFLLHLYLIHALAIPLALMRYGHAGFIFDALPSMGGSPRLYPPNYGYPLWAVYIIWIAAVAVLYPACRWYARLKQTRTAWWLTYL